MRAPGTLMGRGRRFCVRVALPFTPDPRGSPDRIFERRGEPPGRGFGPPGPGVVMADPSGLAPDSCAFWGARTRLHTDLARLIHPGRVAKSTLLGTPSRRTAGRTRASYSLASPTRCPTWPEGPARCALNRNTRSAWARTHGRQLNTFRQTMLCYAVTYLRGGSRPSVILHYNLQF